MAPRGQHRRFMKLLSQAQLPSGPSTLQVQALAEQVQALHRRQLAASSCDSRLLLPAAAAAGDGLAVLRPPLLLASPCWSAQQASLQEQLNASSSSRGASYRQHHRAYGFAAAAALQTSSDPTSSPAAGGRTAQQFASPPAALEPAASTGAAAQEQERHEIYTVKVATGNLRGAGTPSAVKVQLVGSTGGVSEPVLVGGDDPGGTLDRGSTRQVQVRVPPGFGALRRVHLEKRGGNLVSGDGWYLKHIEVQTAAGDRVLFPCDAWLGESDCGGYNGPSERNLLPAILNLAAERPSPVRVRASGVAIPHPEKVFKSKTKGYNMHGFGYGGEDAYYIIENNKGMFSMGVADGVYMWREQGIDSGLMSRRFMEACKQLFADGEEDVVKILHSAESQVQASQLQGSATVCVLTVHLATGQLHSANLGDSGFLVFAPTHGMGYDLKFRTNQLEHSFGCPYQIGHHANANKVEDSDLASFHVMPGDVIVMGSDGLLDNMADLDISREVAAMVREGKSSGWMAQRLTKLAFDASMDKKRVTPYSKGASEAFDMVYTGGKPDDITVMVALVGAPI